MLNEILLMLHPTFGILGILTVLWLFVDILNNNPSTQSRIRFFSILQAILIWLAYFVGGYWYVKYYGADKTLIKAGPWPFAHSFFMEVKEHVFFIMLLLSTYLPIIVFTNPVFINKNARILSLWVCVLIILFGLGMEGSGAIISLGVKVALLAKQI